MTDYPFDPPPTLPEPGCKRLIDSLTDFLIAGNLLTRIDSGRVRVTWGSQFNTLGEGASDHSIFLEELEN